MAGLNGRSFRELDRKRVAVVGLTVTALVILVSLQLTTIQGLFSGTIYTAYFTEAGGARKGDDVRIAGVDVGRVTSVRLAGKRVEIKFSVEEAELGDLTRVSVKSDNALGAKFVAVTPGGNGTVRTIPVARTDPGLFVSEALGNLAANTEQLDVGRISESFESLTTILDRTPTEFRSALSGVSALSKTISSRDDLLGDLLQRASSISGVLAERNAEITSIMGSGSALFGELQQRREALGDLLDNVQGATQQLTGLVADNKTSLKPALTELRQAAALLKKYRGSLAFAAQHLGSYTRSLGEAVGSGPFFQAYLQNLTAPTTLAPIIGNILKGDKG